MSEVLFKIVRTAKNVTCIGDRASYHPATKGAAVQTFNCDKNSNAVELDYTLIRLFRLFTVSIC